MEDEKKKWSKQYDKREPLDIYEITKMVFQWKVLPNNIKTDTEEYRKRYENTLNLEKELEQKRNKIYTGGRNKDIKRVKETRGLTAIEALSELCDDKKPLHLGTFYHHLEYPEGPFGSNVWTAVGTVNGHPCLLEASNNVCFGGALFPETIEKIVRHQMRAQDIGGINYIIFNDSAGLYLPFQIRSFAGPSGFDHIMAHNARMKQRRCKLTGIQTGPGVAGGGYRLGNTQHHYMTEGGFEVISGQAIIQGAQGFDVDPAVFGGPWVHCPNGYSSGYFKDVKTAVKAVRGIVLNGSPNNMDKNRQFSPKDPLYNPDELKGILPYQDSYTRPYEIEDILARILDGSEVCEITDGRSEDYAKGVFTGLGIVDGFIFGIIGTRYGVYTSKKGENKIGGFITREDLFRMTQFLQHCDQARYPIVWFQDIKAFESGPLAEAESLLKHGSLLMDQIIYHSVPQMTIILRNASGAGHYAYCSEGFRPVYTLGTTHVKNIVMEPIILAQALHHARGDLRIEGNTFIPVSSEAQKAFERTVANIEKDANPYKEANFGTFNEIIKLSEMREYIKMFLRLTNYEPDFPPERNTYFSGLK